MVLVRQKALIKGAFVEFECGVNICPSVGIAENNFFGSYSDHGTVCIEKPLDGLTLLESNNMCEKPEVGDRSIPRARNGTQRREEPAVYSTEGQVAK